MSIRKKQKILIVALQLGKQITVLCNCPDSLTDPGRVVKLLIKGRALLIKNCSLLNRNPLLMGCALFNKSRPSLIKDRALSQQALPTIVVNQCAAGGQRGAEGCRAQRCVIAALGQQGQTLGIGAIPLDPLLAQ